MECFRGLTDFTRKHLDAQTATATVAAPVTAQESSTNHQTWPAGLVNPTDTVNGDNRRWSGSTALSNELAADDFTASPHIPHSICKSRTINLPSLY
jgi:hypothetical protein